MQSAGRDDDQPSLALSTDGKTVYLVWAGYLACGTNQCGDIFFAKVDGGVVGPEGQVTQTADEDENTPRAVIDKYNRLIVGYKHFNQANFADVYITWSYDLSTFAKPVNLTPNTDNQDDQGPSSFALHPDTGVPHLIYYSVIPNSNPLNAEVMHAFFVPVAVK
jgi:hypothetical protein